MQVSNYDINKCGGVPGDASVYPLTVTPLFPKCLHEFNNGRLWPINIETINKHGEYKNVFKLAVLKQRADQPNPDYT